MAKKGKLLDYVIGNPPYQADRQGDGTTATPIYNSFMDEAYKIGSAVELITPARFLFNAGYTPKEWNKKMLNDEHLKVLYYNPDSGSVFNNVDIKGGVVITYRDESKNFGAIEVFTRYPEVNDVYKKVIHHAGFNSLTNIIVTSFAYHFTDTMYDENPECRGRASKGHAYDLQSNTFETYPEIFSDTKAASDNIRVLGRLNNARAWKYINRSYLGKVENLDKYKVFLPKAAGIGEFGEVLPETIFGVPGDAATVTFLSIGIFDTENESINCNKYIKTKFVRTMLGILKVTQDITPNKWQYVPLQDFTTSSDIDWSQSISNIDQQLYHKYGLSKEEIDFVESHVKEMS